MRNFIRVLININKIFFKSESPERTMMKDNGSCTQDTTNIAGSRNRLYIDSHAISFCVKLIQISDVIERYICQNIKTKTNLR